MPIVSGIYHHREDGVANNRTEAWKFETNTDGTISVDVTYNNPSYTLKSRILLDSSRKPLEFTYHFNNSFHGKYRIDGNQLVVNRTINDTLLEDTLVWSKDAILDLPFLSCKGNTILYLEKQGTTPTYAPIMVSGDRAGDLAKQSVERIKTEQIEIAGAIYPVTKYHYIRDYWIDEYGVIVRAQRDVYDMILMEYKR